MIHIPKDQFQGGTFLAYVIQHLCKLSGGGTETYVTEFNDWILIVYPWDDYDSALRRYRHLQTERDTLRETHKQALNATWGYVEHDTEKNMWTIIAGDQDESIPYTMSDDLLRDCIVTHSITDTLLSGWGNGLCAQLPSLRILEYSEWLRRWIADMDYKVLDA